MGGACTAANSRDYSPIARRPLSDAYIGPLGGSRSVRRIVYTTNSIEALNSKLRRAVRARGHFPNDEAATKLLYPILNRSGKERKMQPRAWNMAKAQFAVLFGERFIRAMAV